MVHIAQPALSIQIAALEAEIGARLFFRSNRGLTLTDAGVAFLEHARIVLMDVERARDSVNGITAAPKGNVALGLPATVSLDGALAVVSKCRQQFPDIRLKVVEAHSGFLREWLQTGRLDVALLFNDSQDPALRHTLLFEDSLAFVTDPSQKLPVKMELADLAHWPLVLPDPEHDLRRIIDDACAANNVALNVVAEIDSLGLVKRAVAQGIGGTILPSVAVVDEVAAGLLLAVPLASVAMSRRVVIAISTSRPQTVAAGAVAKLLHGTIYHLVKCGAWPAEWDSTVSAPTTP